LRWVTPIWRAPATTSSSAASPASCPAVRGSPCRFAQRPLPSMTTATWAGMVGAGSCGGRAPLGCGCGSWYPWPVAAGMDPPGRSRRARSAFYVVQGAHGALEMPGDRVGDQTAGLLHDRVLGAEHIVPVPGEQEDHVLDRGLADGDRTGPTARRAHQPAGTDVQGVVGSVRPAGGADPQLGRP